MKILICFDKIAFFFQKIIIVELLLYHNRTANFLRPLYTYIQLNVLEKLLLKLLTVTKHFCSAQNYYLR